MVKKGLEIQYSKTLIKDMKKKNKIETQLKRLADFYTLNG